MSNSEFADMRRQQLLGAYDPGELFVKPASGEELAGRTQQLKDYCTEVGDLLDSGKVLAQKMEEKYPDSERKRKMPALGEAIKHYMDLSNQVAGAVTDRAGFGFDTVIYPAFGTDFLAAVAYLSNTTKNRLLTIDSKSVYHKPALRNGQGNSDTLKQALDERLQQGYQYSDQKSNHKLLGIALDLNLLNVPPESLEVVGELTIPPCRGRQQIVVTQTRFSLPDGKNIHHTHMGGVILQTDGWWARGADEFNPDNPRGRFLIDRILQEVTASWHILMLRKAGNYSIGTTAPFYPLLPDGSFVVADLGDHDRKTEMRLFLDLALPDVNLVNMIDSTTMSKLQALENIAPYTTDPYWPKFHYGYLHNGLTGLSIYRVLRGPLTNLATKTIC